MARALVVEDDGDLLELLGRHLERLGCAVTLAKNGRIGLVAVADHELDLAIVDILLPDMDGHNVIEALRAKTGGRCRIVTTSVLDMDPLSSGGDAVLPKPFSRSDVDRVLLPLLEEIEPEHVTRILVADDDLDIRELVINKLELSGYEVVSLSDGDRVLETLRTGTIDLALLDISMPGLSGLEICEAVRADPGLAPLPLILLSARAKDTDIEAGRLAGANDYVTKPFSPKDLLQRVQAALEANPS